MRSPKKVKSKQSRTIPFGRKRKFSFWIFLAQFLIASFIFILFSAYLWGVQLEYDGLKVGYERAFFYSLLVFGAGFSYDSAKKILFLSQPTFILFAKKIGQSFVHTFIIISLCLGTAFSIKNNYLFVGQLLYIAAFCWIWFAINSLTSAIEVATKSELKRSCSD